MVMYVFNMKFINQLKSKFFPKAEISIIHEFHKPPYGGGNQFLMALTKYLRLKGYKVRHNNLTSQTSACIFNSFNFNFEVLENWKKIFPNVKMVHRVDGPITAYRGIDDDVDKRIAEFNNKIADKTILQSNYSYQKHIELGLNFVNPVIIYNAVDDDIFNTKWRITPPNSLRKYKIIAVSWSNNINKGGNVYKWLDENLDFDKFEFSFLGRIDFDFKNIKIIEPVDSRAVAKILKENDIYLTASLNDPCSNSLIEALACGLPAVFANSGGHPELVKTAGVGFNTNEECINAINKVAKNYLEYQSHIDIKSINEVTNEYLKVLFS